MTIQQAFVKLKNDLISWCSLNFKNKADVSTVQKLQQQLDNIEPHPTITEMCRSQEIVLTGLQYGDSLPEDHVSGRVFFLKVEE